MIFCGGVQPTIKGVMLYNGQTAETLSEYQLLFQEADNAEAFYHGLLKIVCQATSSNIATLYSVGDNFESQTIAFSRSEKVQKFSDFELKHEVALIAEEERERLYLSISRPNYSFTLGERTELNLAAHLTRLKLNELKHREELEVAQLEVSELLDRATRFETDAQQWRDAYTALADYAEGLTRQFCRFTRKLESLTEKAGISQRREDCLEHLRHMSSEATAITRRLARRTLVHEADSEYVNMNDVIGRVQQDFLPLFEERRVRLSRSRLPIVLGSKEAITTVLQELIENSLVHGKVGGKLHLDFTEDAESWHFVLIDDGVGIEPDLREKVFCPFFKVSKPESVSRAGLGLFTCQHLVNAWGGRIWMSQSREKGCAVHWTLPRAASQ